MPLVAKCQLVSQSPYSQSRHYLVDKKPKESAKDFEARTWRERMHFEEDGRVFIPPMAFKNCLSDIAAFLGEQIAGKGKSTYRKHFESGVLVLEKVYITPADSDKPYMKDEVPGEWHFLPSDGKRGGGKRVDKCYPLFQTWKGTVDFNIFDSTITRPVFEKHLKEAGQFIGIGRFRPAKNGFYGRFKLAAPIVWEETDDA